MTPLIRRIFAGLLLLIVALALVPGTAERVFLAGVLAALFVAYQVAFTHDIFNYLRRRGASSLHDRVAAGDRYSDTH